VATQPDQLNRALAAWEWLKTITNNYLPSHYNRAKALVDRYRDRTPPIPKV